MQKAPGGTSKSLEAAPITLPRNLSAGIVTGKVVVPSTTSPSVALPPLTALSRQSYLESLVAVSNAVNATDDQTTIGEILAAHTVEMLEVSGVLVQMVDDHGWVQGIASRGLSSEFLAAQNGPMEESIAGRAITEGRVFATWDMRQASDPRLSLAAEYEGVVAVACMPMIFGGQAVGTLNIYCHHMRRFTEEEFHILSLLAAQGAIALTNAGSFRALKAHAEEVRQGFQRVGEALSASLDLGETLQLIIQLSVEMVHADAGAVYMLESGLEGSEVRLAALHGLDRRSARRFRNGPLSPLARRTLNERRIEVVPDTRRMTDTAFPTLRLPDDQPGDVRSIACVPLLLGDKPVGVLEQYSVREGAFQQQDLDLLATFAHQAAVAIERAQLFAQERHIAETLQRAFLPELPRSVAGFQIGCIYAPGNVDVAVGGDTYDLFTLPDGRITAVIADVTGNGTVAATVAVMIKYSMRAYALENAEPGSILSRVNEAALHQTDEDTYVTACCALIDPKERTVSFANAGHPPILYYRSREKDCVIGCGEPGIMAGLLPQQQYETHIQHLNPGDVLVFYTDGVTEARRKKEMFGQERLSRVLCEHSFLCAQDIAATIYRSVTDFVEGERADDIALLVLKAI